VKILVTGAAGFIGSNLVRHLIQDCNHEVLAVDKLTYAGNLASLDDLKSVPEFSFLQADICDVAAMQKAFNNFQPEAIMHLAAESHVDRSIDGPEAFIQTNIIGTYQLLQLSRRYYEDLSEDGRATFRFQRNHSLRSALAVLSQQSRFGSLGTSLARHLRFASCFDQLLQ